MSLARHRGLHGPAHIDRQRRTALLMIGTGLARVLVWMILCGLYLARVPFAVELFKSVAFVALLSVLALALTDWGQVAASLAQLTAGDAHADAEHTRRAVTLDAEALRGDLAQLARMQPGPDAEAVAQRIEAQVLG